MELERAAPEKCGIRSKDVLSFVNELCDAEENQETHSFILIRHKKVLCEAYFSPYDKNCEHTIFSCSKAFAAMAVGFAVNEGLISLKAYISDYFPELLPEKVQPEIRRITVENLLTMTTGQAAGQVHSETVTDSDNQAYTFFRRNCTVEPGSSFRYDGFATYMLSALIGRVSGENMIQYLKPRLFEPLRIKMPYHIKDKYGVCVGYTGIRLRLRDFAKIGQMFLDKGTYEGKQVLPAYWVKLSTEKHVDTPKVTTGEDWNQGYCYQLWRGRHNTFRFCGAFGQMCVVMPELDAIFAINSGYDNNKIHRILDLFYKHILENMHPGEISEDKESCAELESTIKKLCLDEKKSEYGFAEFDKELESKYGYSRIGTKISGGLCHVHIYGKDKDICFDAGIGYGNFSEVQNTEFVAINPDVDYAKFYSSAYCEGNKYVIKVRIYGTPTILIITADNDENGTAEMQVIRGK